MLVEGSVPGRPGFVRGTSCRYVPVAFRGHAPALVRMRVPVRAVGLDGDALLGEPEQEGEAAPAGRVALPLV